MADNRTERTRTLAILVTAMLGCLLGVSTLANDIRGVHCSEVMISGRLEYRIQAAQSGPYAPGQPISVEVVLTNLSDAALDVCDDCVGEGIRILRSGAPPTCGFIVDHVTGYVPKVISLAPGKSVSRRITLTDMPCAPDQPGKYEVRGTYAFHSGGRDHDTDPPDYCISANPLQIEVVRR